YSIVPAKHLVRLVPTPKRDRDFQILQSFAGDRDYPVGVWQDVEVSVELLEPTQLERRLSADHRHVVGAAALLSLHECVKLFFVARRRILVHFLGKEIAALAAQIALVRQIDDRGPNGSASLDFIRQLRQERI